MFRRDVIKLAGAAGASLLLPTRAARAQDVLLTVDGAVEGGAHGFTDADLSALPKVEFDTTTIWTEGVQRFCGPSVFSVLDAAGAGRGDLTLRAINDYVVNMPRDVIEATVPIIANRIDGEPFSVRDKGPLWVVFPYDSDERYRSETLYAYSVWQLVGITVG